MAQLSRRLVIDNKIASTAWQRRQGRQRYHFRGSRLLSGVESEAAGKQSGEVGRKKRTERMLGG